MTIVKMKYIDIIKSSKFYLPINLNLGYLLSDTEIMILMTIIHCHEIGVEVSISKLNSFTARSESTVKRALKQLKALRLVSGQGYTPCYEQIEMVYDSVNSAKSIEERKKWCAAYKKNKGQIEPLMVGQSEPMKMGQNEPSSKGQFEPTYKEDINKEYNINKEEIKYNINNNILEKKKLLNNSKEESENFEEDLALVTEGGGGNLNESKSKIERNEDSNQSQPFENILLTPSENKEIAMVFKGLEWNRPNVNPNVFNDCLDLLHNVLQSNADNYKERFAYAYNQFKVLLKGYSKEERTPLNKALCELSSVLGGALTNKNIKKE